MCFCLNDHQVEWSEYAIHLWKLVQFRQWMSLKMAWIALFPRRFAAGSGCIVTSSRLLPRTWLFPICDRRGDGRPGLTPGCGDVWAVEDLVFHNKRYSCKFG